MEREVPIGFPLFDPLKYSHGLFMDMKTKEDAIDFMTYKVKRIEKRKKHLMRELNHLEKLEKILSVRITEIAKMDNPSPKELTKIIRKTYREIALKKYDTED